MLTRNAFDDQESKQINMAESIHKFKCMFPWGLGVDPPKGQSGGGKYVSNGANVSQ